jgi:hypothetical protein
VFTHGFRDRGDAPWGVSETTGTYPYSTLSWGVADDRRANHELKFIRTSVTNSTGVPYLGQESIGTIWEDPRSSGANTPVLAITKSAGGKEGHYKIYRPVFSGGSSRGISIAGVDNSDLIEGVVIVDADITGFSSDDAVRLSYAKSPKVVRPQIYANTGQIGLNFLNCFSPTVHGMHSSPGNNFAIQVGVSDLADIGVAEFFDSDCRGNTTAGLSCGFPMNLRNVQGGPSAQTTTATVNNSTQRFGLTGGNYYKITVGLTGQTGTSADAFKKTILARDNAGSAVVIGALTDVHADINPDALGGLNMVAVGGQIRVNITGKAATTVDWVVSDIQCELIA